MALEPVSDQPVTNTPVEQTLAATLQSALLGDSPPSAAPEETPPVTPVAPAEPPPADPAPTPAAPADPVKELTGEEEPSSKLPIEEEEEPTEPEEPVTGDKAGKRIQMLKEEIKTSYKPKIAELEAAVQAKEARLAELEAQVARTKELEDQVAQFKKEISVVRLEQTPEFVKEVTEPLRELSNKVASIADTYGVDQSKLVAAIAETDETKRRGLFKTILSGVDVDVEDQIALREIAAKTHEIYAREDALYADADGALAELAAKRESETAAQAAARAEERSKAAELSAAAITKALPFLNDLIPDITKKVKDTPLETLDPTRAAYNALAGEVLPKVKKELSRLQSENDSLLDELSKYRKATPRASGPTGSTPAGPQKHTDLASALMAGAGMIGH